MKLERMIKPSFVGIGGQRCGTTWIFNMIQQHPEVYSLNDKELHFFSHNYIRGFEWYLRHFNIERKIFIPRKSLNSLLRGEFSTSYLYHPDVPKRVFDFDSDIKILVSLRNPIDRAISQHKHEIALGYISGDNLNFMRALEKNPSYIEQGLYHKHLKKWFKEFPQENIKVILFKEISENPLDLIQDIYQFLGIAEDFVPKRSNEKISKSFVPKSRALEKFFHKPASFLNKMRANWVVQGVKTLGVKRLKEIINANQKLNSRALDPETRSKLKEIFSEDVINLEKLIDRDLSHWQID